jgi:glycine betaine/choline ABC-type transport system substrate-binding protein
MSAQFTRRYALTLLGGALGTLAGCERTRADTIVIGSKNFTEQIILAELLAQQVEAHTSLRVDRRLNLGGTLICHRAMLAGQMDIYAEYTGTALAAVLNEPLSTDPDAVYRAVRDGYRDRFGFDVGPPLGFNNTFAIVVRSADAKKFKLHTISDLVPYARQWRAGFGYEFMERSDGYPGLVRAYGLKFAAAPSIMDLGLLYRALKEHQVDVVAGSSTDGLIMALDMVILEDNRHFFPPYQAVTIVRGGTLRDHPELHAPLDALGGKISDSEMRQLNYAVDAQQRDPAAVARDFRRQKNL